MSNIGLTEAEVNEIKEEREAKEKIANLGRTATSIEREHQKAQKKLPVMEIFGPTIQGEGMMAGVRTSFIRFGLCDYRCAMCDSMHAVDPARVKENAKYMTQEEIAKALFKQHTGYDENDIEEVLRKTLWEGNAHWVTFSGGNPCMHDLTELIKRIRSFQELMGELKIAVETQGTLFPSWLPICDVVTVSPKSPGMGEKFEPERFIEFVMKLKHHRGFNVKVVVFSAQDIEFARHINDIMKDNGLEDRMYLSQGNATPPGLDKLEGEEGFISRDDLRIKLMNEYEILVEDLLAIPDMDNVKFLPQLHVLAWGNKMGV